MAEKPSLVDKASVANVCAGLLVIGGLIFSFWQKDAELVKAMTYIALGYLFKTVTK